mmetsp:Transcript_11542/g.18806  ORF Transcript_11542/g.18806 Transcript_11542/m.18806 type:complete len:184 (+) Transcript_11542:187-738(+)|eukprot:CAMPEP_0184675750 /NCGR_PEP_ID=MMETSP0308-20130426/87961_1 /TAXON_ID=38269 /ORGANISM="Gloeochaete witrockiana, Strain SAG 46.84" /LENGTH=183 /DNA_ID=CAMNT_0027123493 /DNA_START=133 /DNA_END=684 /DNA_ORIENTATION=+
MARFAVCVDGSAGADNAFETAVSLMKTADSLVVLAVTEIDALDSAPILLDDLDLAPTSADSRSDVVAELSAASQVLLRRYVARGRAKGFPCTSEELMGNARDAICDWVEAHKPDIVVVGSRGLGLVKRIVLGSVSDYLVHHCKCPILVVKQHEAGTSSVQETTKLPAHVPESSTTPVEISKKE